MEGDTCKVCRICTDSAKIFAYTTSFGSSFSNFLCTGKELPLCSKEHLEVTVELDTEREALTHSMVIC